MSRNYVHAGKRLKVLATNDYTAGQLVYERGWFGVVQDDVTAGDIFTLILREVWELPKFGAGNVAMGTRFAAAPSAASTVVLYPETPAGSVPSGAVIIGRSIATSNASVVKLALFGSIN